MIDINTEINSLLKKAINYELIDERDEIYVRNKILKVLNLKIYDPNAWVVDKEIIDTLDVIEEWAVKNSIIMDSDYSKEELKAKIMDIIIGPPSKIINEFYKRYNRSSKDATDYFYELSILSNYIQVNKIKNNVKWKIQNQYGEFHITINVVKPPEKKSVGLEGEKYPKCILCKEIEGMEANKMYPTRANHRTIPIEVNGHKWYFYYSPYSYFKEHAVIINENHVNMKINKNTFEDILEIVDKFKHYRVGSNADLPIVGGSILSHNHYQGGNYTFPIEQATSIKNYTITGFEDLQVVRLNWPITVIRIIGVNKKNIIELADKILNHWKSYSDLTVDVINNTNSEQHNTITPIARYRDGKYELDLALRNNRVTEEYDKGIFGPHKEVHNIKSENIGLIEVLGVAILPRRLYFDINEMREYFYGSKELTENLMIHKYFLINLEKNYNITKENFDEIIKEEIGKRFVVGLEHCGVYKNTKEGEEAFERFIYSV